MVVFAMFLFSQGFSTPAASPPLSFSPSLCHHLFLDHPCLSHQAAILALGFVFIAYTKLFIFYHIRDSGPVLCLVVEYGVGIKAKWWNYARTDLPFLHFIVDSKADGINDLEGIQRWGYKKEIVERESRKHDHKDGSMRL